MRVIFNKNVGFASGIWDSRFTWGINILGFVGRVELDRFSLGRGNVECCVARLFYSFILFEKVKIKMVRKRLKIGETRSSGQKVKSIIAYGPEVRVFVAEDDSIGWEYDGKDNLSFSNALAIYNELSYRVKHFVPNELQKICKEELGHSFYLALSGGSDKSKYFSEVKMFIDSKAKERSRLHYLLWCTVTVFVFWGFAIPFYYLINGENLHLVILGCIAGSLGSLLSVLQRSSDLHIDPYGTEFYLSLQGVARAALGTLFGAVLIIASKSNLVFGFVNDNKMGLFIFSIIAGFSERFVPEILNRIESDQI